MPRFTAREAVVEALKKKVISSVSLCNINISYLLFNDCKFNDCFHYNYIQGLYRGAKNNEMKLGRCSRTNDVIEPMIKPQWYVNCHVMGKKALDVATNDENKKLEFIQKQYTAEWRRFCHDDEQVLSLILLLLLIFD